MRPLFTAALLLAGLSACSAGETPAAQGRSFETTAIASFDEPWAMTFLHDGRLLVTEQPGRLLIVTQNGQKSTPPAGVPKVDYGGQGGLGVVALHPDFAAHRRIYLSYSTTDRKSVGEGKR